MPAYKGANQISKIALGDGYIAKVYHGEDLVFSSGPAEKQSYTGSFLMSDGGTLLAGDSFDVALPGVVTPRLAFFAWSGTTALNTPSAGDAQCGRGASDGTNHWAITASEQNNVPTINNGSSFITTGCIRAAAPAGTAAGAATVTFGDEVMTITLSTNFTNDMRVAFLVLGGANVKGKVGSFTSRGTAGTDTINLGWGTDVATALIMGSWAGGVTVGVNQGHSFGFTASLGIQAVCSWGELDNQPNTTYYGVYRDSYCAHRPGTAGTNLSAGRVTAWGAGTITVTWDVAAAQVWGYAALTGMTARATSFNGAMTSTPFDTAALGFTPVACMAHGCNRQFNPTPSPSATFHPSVGFSDGVRNFVASNYYLGGQAAAVLGRVVRDDALYCTMASQTTMEGRVKVDSFNPGGTATLSYPDPDPDLADNISIIFFG